MATPKEKVLIGWNPYYWENTENEADVMLGLTANKTYAAVEGGTFLDDSGMIREYNAYKWDEPLFKDEGSDAEPSLPKVEGTEEEGLNEFRAAVATSRKAYLHEQETFGPMGDPVDLKAKSFHCASDDPKINPKKAMGAVKAPMTALPDIALIQANNVMAGGAHKYGLYNFREAQIDAMTYIGAIKRHFLLWADGVDVDAESYQNHLAHIIADCAILLDASLAGNMIDNRSKTGLVAKELKKSAKTFARYQTQNESIDQRKAKES